MSEQERPEVPDLEAALSRALEELEEHRVAAIELRMLLDASEARLQSMTRELEEARACGHQADERAEVSQVESIEMRVILDATRHRAAKLEDELAASRRELESLAAERRRLAAEIAHARDERRVMAGMLADAGAKLGASDAMRAEIEALQGRLAAGESAADGVVAELRARIAEHEAERAAHAAKIAELEGQVPRGDEIGRERAQNASLRERVADLERELAEAAERHAGELRRTAVEIGQRAEQVAAAEVEVARLAAALEAAGRERDELQLRLERAQSESKRLRRQARDLRPDAAAGEAAPEEVEGGEDLEGLLESADLEGGDGEPGGRRLRLQGGAATAAPSGANLTVAHLDERPEYREAVEAVVAHFPPARYLAAVEFPSPPLRPPTLLVVNLLAADIDALAAAADADRWGLPDAAAFTYCADAGRGVVLGLVDFFPEPFDADACAARLLERGRVQRLLVVSDDIGLTNEIRATMSRFQLSTSVALDSRQAFELAALVRPDYALVDLNLPRGEGLRLVARLRLEPKTAALPTALLWNRRIEASDLRAQAARVARETALRIDDLTRGLQQTLLDRDKRDSLRRTA